MRVTCRGMRDGGDMRDMRDGPPPRKPPRPAAVFGPAPLGEMGTANTHQNDTIHKKECFFLFNRLIHSVLIHYFNIRLLLLVLIMYNH